MVVLTREETTYRPALWTRQHDSLAMRVRNFNQATTIDHGSFFFANNRCGVCIGSVDVFRRLNFNILRILLRLENFKKQNIPICSEKQKTTAYFECHLRPRRSPMLPHLLLLQGWILLPETATPMDLTPTTMTIFLMTLLFSVLSSTLSKPLWLLSSLLWPRRLQPVTIPSPVPRPLPTLAVQLLLPLKPRLNCSALIRIFSLGISNVSTLLMNTHAPWLRRQTSAKRPAPVQANPMSSGNVIFSITSGGTILWLNFNLWFKSSGM